jgi:hypothetical protein
MVFDCFDFDFIVFMNYSMINSFQFLFVFIKLFVQTLQCIGKEGTMQKQV